MQYSIGGDPTIIICLTWELAAEAGCILAAPVAIRRELRDRRATGYLPVLVDRLEDCLNNLGCGKTATPLPTRVLDLGTSPLDNIRLYTTSRESARYIAFSHCWGSTGKLQLRTTLQNFASNTDRYRPIYQMVTNGTIFRYRQKGVRSNKIEGVSHGVTRVQ
jgi:hypothetical protein